MSRYYTEPKLNASGGGGSSLTIREADGTPSGVVTELVFPNTSVSIASGVGTLSVVPSFDTSITGGRNAFIVEPPPVAGQQANLLFESHSGPSGDDFGIARILANAEEGIQLVAKGNGGSDPSYNLSILPTGYAVTQASNFRTAIDAAASSHTHGNISNAGAIGDTTDLIVVTGASGVLTTANAVAARGLLGVNTERIQVALSANGQNISSGTKKGVIPILVNGNITAFRIDCDPANEPSAIAVQCDLNRIDRSTGTATTVLSSVASIATGANTGTGTINGTQSVAVGDMLTIDIDQGSDGRELIASITITLT